MAARSQIYKSPPSPSIWLQQFHLKFLQVNRLSLVSSKNLHFFVAKLDTFVYILDSSGAKFGFMT